MSGSFTPTDPAVYQFVNFDRVRVKGAEARFEGRAPNGLYTTMALSYATGTIRGAGDEKMPLSTIDPLKLVVGLGYRAPDGRFGGQLIATYSAQKALSRTVGVDSDGDPATICDADCYRPASFVILDATAFVRVVDGVTLRAGIFNILDRKYAWWSDVRGLTSSSTVLDAYTQPGRNASISLSYRF